MNLSSSFSGIISLAQEMGVPSVYQILLLETTTFWFMTMKVMVKSLLLDHAAYQSSTWIRWISYSSSVRLTNDTVSPSLVLDDCTIVLFVTISFFKPPMFILNYA